MGVLKTIHGVHRVVVVGDEKSVTKEMLEKRIEYWDDTIANWQPENAWDAANQRPLKWYKKYRTAARKALDRQEVKERELGRQKERENSRRIYERLEF